MIIRIIIMMKMGVLTPCLRPFGGVVRPPIDMRSIPGLVRDNQRQSIAIAGLVIMRERRQEVQM